MTDLQTSDCERTDPHPAHYTCAYCNDDIACSMPHDCDNKPRCPGLPVKPHIVPRDLTQ